MKKIILSVLSVFTVTLFSFAQITEGQISYSVQVSSDVENMQEVLPSLKESYFNVYFNEVGIRTEMHFGELISLYSVASFKSVESLLYMENPVQGNKAMIVANKSIDKAYSKEKGEIKIELIEETKEIAGYKCKKAIVVDTKGNELTYWYTEDIKVDKSYANYINRDLPGMPLEFDFVQDDLILHFTAGSLKYPIEHGISFEIEMQEGYEEWTFEEMWLNKPK